MSEPPLRLRRATPADYDDIASVVVAAYAGFVDGPDDPYLDRLRDSAARDRGAELWVATDRADQRVLGTVTLCPRGSSWREIGRPGEGEFRMLAVAPDAQGQGVGRTLVELALDYFAERDAHTVVLSSLATMTAAHRLYTRSGFVRVPARDWSPAPGVQLVAFSREL